MQACFKIFICLKVRKIIIMFEFKNMNNWLYIFSLLLIIIVCHKLFYKLDMNVIKSNKYRKGFLEVIEN